MDIIYTNVSDLAIGIFIEARNIFSWYNGPMKYDYFPDLEEMEAPPVYSCTNPIVYFMACGEYIKIGKTLAAIARKRLCTLQIGNPHKIVPLGFIDACFKSEADLHAMFSTYWHQGEWFRSNSELLKYIEDYAEPWVF